MAHPRRSIRPARSALVVLVAATLLATAGCTPVAPENFLRIAIAQSETTLSVQDFSAHSFTALDQIFEPLIRYRADGTFAPALAESFAVSDDGLRLTFELRPDVVFSDGSPFTAEVALQNLNSWVGNPDNSFLGISTRTASIDSPAPNTLVWTLTEPYYPALNELALVRPPRFMAPSSFDAAGELLTPIGTGPFRIDSITPAQIDLVANDRHWGEASELDGIRFAVIPDSQARLAALQSGEVDIIGGEYLAPLAVDDLPELAADPRVTVLQAPSTTNLLLTFNPASPVEALREARFRAAVAASLNTDLIASGLFNDIATPATAVFPDSVPYAAAADDAAAMDAAPVAADAALAADDTLVLVLNPDLFPQAKSLGEVVQAQLGEQGITVQLDILDPVAYADRVARGAYDLAFTLTYGAPYDPFSTLNSYFRQSEPGHVYASAELDALIAQSTATLSSAERQASYDDIAGLLARESAVVPLVQLPRLWAVGADVAGFELGPTEYDLPLAGVSLTR